MSNSHSGASIHEYEGIPDDSASVEVNEKDLPIDPIWELQQKKTFTAWCNAHLRKVNTQIDVIEEDFRDGLKLMMLLEVISDEKLPKPEKGKLRFHKIANVNKALNFISSKGVKLVSIGAEEIIDGNVKMTLGMIWTIILRFAIQNISFDDISAKDGLLLWCQRQTASYKNVNVTNFHTSFKDGLAFSALIHKHRPDLIDYNSLKKENSLENLNTAFAVAEEKLDIPRMLDPVDMTNNEKPDERSVMAYVSSYYHFFTNERQANVAVKRICKILHIMQENEQMMQQYESLFSMLLQWIELKIVEYKSCDSQESVENVQNLLDKLRNYQAEEKPVKLEEKAQLENTFSTLQTRLRLSNRPAYVPGAGSLISDINQAWTTMETYEKSYEKWLLEELQRLERLATLKNKFHVKCRNHESWSKLKNEQLAEDDVNRATLAELRAMMRKHEAFCSDVQSHVSRVDTIKSLGEELIKSTNKKDSEPVQERLDKLLVDWDSLLELVKERKVLISDLHEIREHIDTLHLDYAKKCAPFNAWLEQAIEDLEDEVVVHSTVEVERLINEHDQFKESLQNGSKSYEEINSIREQVDQLAQENNLISASENPYTHVQPIDLSNCWQKVLSLESDRTEMLIAAQNRLALATDRQKEFAEMASKLDDYLTENLNKTNDIALQGSGTLEEQRDALLQLVQEVESRQSGLNDLDQVNQELHKSFVFDNPFTTLTIDQVRIKWNQLIVAVRATVNQVENQILTRDSKGLTQAQMEDFRKCFNHFDRDRTQRLEPQEFKALLVSLEYNLREDSKTPEAEFLRIMQSVDPDGLGYVTFEAFLDFMTREISDQDTVEQITESFRFLGGEKGYLTEEDLRRELPPDEAEYCINKMHEMSRNTTNGTVELDFDQFSKNMFS